MKTALGLSSLAVLLVLAVAAPDYAEEARDTIVLQSFAKAWQAKHDTKTERDELAVRLYREAWLGPSLYAIAIPLSLSGTVQPFPDDASAESILRGQHGDASPQRLWETTNDICLDFFTERHAAVLKAMAADCQGDSKTCQKVVGVLGEWKRRLYRQGAVMDEDEPVLQGKAKLIWGEVVRGLYPVVSKRFQEVGVFGSNEPLAYILRDLGDPRAIALLLGKNGRDLRYFELIRSLQRRRKAEPSLVRLLSDPDPDTRWRTTYALAESADPELEPLAIRLLGDDSPKVRHEALNLAFFLLSPLRPKLEAEFRALLKDPDLEVRQYCVILLASRKDMTCAPALLELLRNERIGELPHGNLVRAMQNLAGQSFGYHIGSDAWQPTTPNNRAALDRFAAWVAERHQR